MPKKKRTQGKQERPGGAASALRISHQKPLPLAAACALVLAPVILLLPLWAALATPMLPYNVGDLREYYLYSGQVLGGRAPYLSFHLEYPPLCLLPMMLVRFAAGGQNAPTHSYTLGFAGLSVALCMVLAVLLLRLRRNFDRTVICQIVVLLAFTLLLSPYLPWRYDLFPAALTLAAFVAAIEGRPTFAGVFLGLGVAAKLYPLLLLPIFAVALWSWQRRRAALVGCAACAAICALIFLPFLALSPEGLQRMVLYQTGRGIQIESAASGLIMLAHLAGHGPVAWEFAYGGVQIESPTAGVVLKVLPVVGALLLGASLWIGGRALVPLQTSDKQARITMLATASVAAILAFILANKVFSPQYLIWLLPFLPLLPGRFQICLLIAGGLTTFIFPFHYAGLYHFQPAEILVLNARNGILLIVFICALFFLWRIRARRGQAKSVSQ